ncbi:MAG: aminotransferase class V-fold PLP-dependent enzyme, partial [Christensenellales bacterium]
MIYLDNASTTNKKPLSVKLAVLKAFFKRYCANPGRSSHKYSLNAEKIVFETRERAKDFFNNDSVQNVIFTGGCTEALNIAIFGTLKKGGNVIYTTNEHNSVARPLEYLKNQNLITTTLIKTEQDGTTSPQKIEDA